MTGSTGDAFQKRFGSEPAAVKIIFSKYAFCIIDLSKYFFAQLLTFR